MTRATSSTTAILELPFQKIPLSMNDRKHWRAKAAVTKQVRETVRILAIAAQLPRNLDHVTVTLHYAPASNRRLDADNLVATLKPCADGLVDHGLVDDDIPALMSKRMPVVEPKSTTGMGRMWLSLEWAA